MGSSDRKDRKKDKKKDKRKKHRHDKYDSDDRRERKKQTKLDYLHEEYGKQSSRSPSDNRERSSETSSQQKEAEIEPDKNVVSLSVDETNKLRAKLGLKPLDVSTDSGDVHVPAKNIGKIAATEKLAEKMKTLQEKRRIKQQLSRVRSLGNSSVDLTDTLAWVSRNRNMEAKKAAADARTKMLDSMDADFGVDELMESDKFSRKHDYSSQDLKDLTVLHDVNSFKEGDMTILTLQDKGILDEDNEDVLVNVNMLDDERYNKNNDLKKNKPDYNPYTEDIDEFGNVKSQNMLSKYDEVIKGEKKKSFRISEGINTEEIKLRMAQGLRNNAASVSLDFSHLKKTATEYFTTDEVAAFKKPRNKKVRKIRKTTVDDIMPLPSEGSLTSTRDHGSRSRHGGKQEKRRTQQSNNEENMEIDIDQDHTTQKKDSDRGKVSEWELYQVRAEDDDAELQAALSRSRRSNIKQEKNTLVETIFGMNPSEETIRGVAKTSQIILDSTAEFAKGIGTEEETVEKEEEVMEVPQTDTKTNEWKDVDFVTAQFGEFQDYDPTQQQEVIEAEPLLQRGLTGALHVAQRKGFIEVDKHRGTPKDISDAIKATGSLRARFFQVDRDTGQDVDNRRRGDREYGGMFPEKKNYNPDVKIVYTDNIGRELNSKEAFRQLSHKFHGKGSGKMKTEKRMKKALEQMALKKMDSDDTPLGSAALLRDKQKEANSSYIVLSGGNRIPSDVNTSLSKVSKR